MKEKIETYIRNANFISEDFQGLEHVRTGDSNTVYCDKSRNVLIKVNREDRTDRLDCEARILEFLEDSNFRTAKLLGFQRIEDNSVLSQEFIGSKDVEFSDLGKIGIVSLVKYLSKVHSINIEDYNQFFNESREKEISSEEYFNRKIKNLKSRWQKVPRSISNYEEINGLYETGLSVIKSYPYLKLKQCFCHLDFICNMRSIEDQIFLVDWELADIDLPEYSLVVQMRRGRLDEGKRKNLVNNYREISERDLILNDLERQLWSCFLLQDMLWAAKMAGKTENEKYGRKLRDRKKRLKHYLENNELKMEKMYDET